MGKYDQYISYVPKPDKPGDIINTAIQRKIAWTEDSFIPGAPYFEIMWFCGPREPRPATHTHTFYEILGFIGGDPENVTDLGATVKFLFGDEWYTFTKSVLVYVPAGIPHSPMIIEDVKRPFIHFSGGPNVPYIRETVEESGA